MQLTNSTLNRPWTRLACAAAAMFFFVGADNTGCRSESSDDVNQDRIFTSYWLFYDEQADVTYARAQFRLGSASGTTLILQSPAAVDFDGRPMGFNELLDWHEVEVAGRVDQGTFRYADANGSTFSNVVRLAGAIGAPADLPATLSGAASFELTWSGMPTGNDELVVAIVARDANRFDFVRFETRALGSTSIVFAADRLGTVGRGAAVLTIRRNRDSSVSEAPSAGGSVLSTYQSRETVFTLE